MFVSSCTALKLTSEAGKPYWFRTCDIGGDIWKEGAHVVSFPTREELCFNSGERRKPDHAILGVTYGPLDTWLMDGVNDAGLVGGLLALYDATSVPKAREGCQGVVGMELVTWLLSCCASATEVVRAAKKLQVLDVPLEWETVPSSAHYMFVDAAGRCVILEAADPEDPGTLTAYEDNLGLLTNSPPYPRQLDNLRWFLSQSPELNWGKEGKVTLRLNGMTVTADTEAEHCSMGGIFPASYASYDRFVRMAVLSYLNHEGRDFPDERMLPMGNALMSPVLEPHNQGVFHYTAFDKDKGPIRSLPSYTQYVVMYDPSARALYLHPYGVSAWTKVSLADCSREKPQRHTLCQLPLGGVIEWKPEKK